jgi:hypothetical protein
VTEPKRRQMGARQIVTLLILLALASLALAYTVDVRLVDEPGVRMALPATVGGWTGTPLRYCHAEGCRREVLLEGVLAGAERCPDCGERLYTMSREEYDALPKDTEFLKSLYTDGEGRQLHVGIVLSGQDRSSIHRPQRCLTGQGHEIRSSRRLTVPLAEDGAIDVMVLRNAANVQTPEGPTEYRTFYAYWFVGQGRETPSHGARMFWLAYDRVVNSVAHKWAYIAVSGRRLDDAEAENELIRDFIATLHREIVL